MTALIIFNKTKVMCQFFEKRGYRVSVAQAGHHSAKKLIDSQHHKWHGKYRSYFIHTHIDPHNQAVKSTILRNFKLLQNDPEIGSNFL